MPTQWLLMEICMWWRKVSAIINDRLRWVLGLVLCLSMTLSMANDINEQAVLDAAHAGDAESQYQLAVALHEKKHEESMGWFIQSASQNYAKAQLALAQMYREGEACWLPKRPVLAVHWYKEALKTGDDDVIKDASYELGILYRDGEGVSSDLNQYHHHVNNAAAEEHPDAMREMARIYYQGLSDEEAVHVEQNYWQASKWYARSVIARVKNHLSD